MSASTKRLRDTPRSGRRVLLTGGTGFLGSMIAARVLHDGWAGHLVLPTRRADGQRAPAEVAGEYAALGGDQADLEDRITTVAWDSAESATLESLVAMLKDGDVDTIVHCAGCLDYFDIASLNALNVEFTRRLTLAARDAGIGLFVFVSTAYAAGYSGAPVPEGPLAEPDSDPTQYTATKRAAEAIVAGCGVPFLVVRPSIVIGSSVDGRYSGRRYGIYQQWMGVERLLSDRYHPELHTVATDSPLNLLHQDAFQASMADVLRWVPDDSHVNLVIEDGSGPSSRQLWRLLCELTRPATVVFYPGVDRIDLRSLNIRQRAYLTFAQTNLEISGYGWRFDRGWLQALAANGLHCGATTMATMRVCQDRFMAASAPMQRYFERFADQFPTEIEYRDCEQHPAAALASASA